MKKKDLLNITLPDVPEELIKTARNDEYMERDFSMRNYGRYTEKSYRTRLYFGASKADGILVVRMWSRVQLEKGIYDPISATYIDAAAEKWITRTDGSWSEAMLQNIKAMYILNLLIYIRISLKINSHLSAKYQHLACFLL